MQTEPSIREICEGKGRGIISIPFEEAGKMPNVKIDSLQEFQAVANSYIKQNLKFDSVFEHGMLNEYGYPEAVEHSHMIGLETNRSQIVIERPLQEGSTKTLIDDSPESKLYMWGDAIVDLVFNKNDYGAKYKLGKFTLLKTEPKGRRQFKHYDYKGHNKKNDPAKTDFGVIIPINIRASFCGWDWSHHIVHANDSALDEGLSPGESFAFVRNILLNNPHFEIDIDECIMREFIFGLNEMCIFTDNFVHAGSSNPLPIAVYRLHMYVVRQNVQVPDNYTVIPEDVVWDLTKGDVGAENYLIGTNFNVSSDASSSTSGANKGANKDTATNTKKNKVQDRRNDEPVASSSAKKRGRPPKKKRI